MSSLPARRRWKGEGDAGALRPGLGQTMPAGHHSGGGYLTGWCAPRRSGRLQGLASRYRERGERGSALAQFVFPCPSPPWSPRGSWKGAGWARNPKGVDALFFELCWSLRSSTNLEDLGLPKPPPSMLGGEVRNLFYPSAPTSLADRRAL